MGLVLLSFMLAIIGGAILWLALGDRFPLDTSRDRWPTVHNIAAYAVLLVIPIYLFIFAVN